MKNTLKELLDWAEEKDLSFYFGSDDKYMTYRWNSDLYVFIETKTKVSLEDFLKIAYILFDSFLEAIKTGNMDTWDPEQMFEKITAKENYKKLMFDRRIQYS